MRFVLKCRKQTKDGGARRDKANHTKQIDWAADFDGEEEEQKNTETDHSHDELTSPPGIDALLT
jgi:hypothetical protein